MVKVPANLDVTTNPNFMTWFGGSRVVDGRGKPLVVYHGSDKFFDVFNTEPVNRPYVGLGASAIGSHFTESREIAKDYPVGRNKECVFEVYLSIKYPKKYTTYRKLHDDLYEFYKSIKDEYKMRYGVDLINNKLELVTMFKAKLISEGYDGITYLEGFPHNITKDKARVWVAFHPNQIKAAGNNTTFSVYLNSIFK